MLSRGVPVITFSIWQSLSDPQVAYIKNPQLSICPSVAIEPRYNAYHRTRLLSTFSCAKFECYCHQFPEMHHIHCLLKYIFRLTNRFAILHTAWNGSSHAPCKIAERFGHCNDLYGQIRFFFKSELKKSFWMTSKLTVSMFGGWIFKFVNIAFYDTVILLKMIAIHYYGDQNTLLSNHTILDRHYITSRYISYDTIWWREIDIINVMTWNNIMQYFLIHVL